MPKLGVNIDHTASLRQLRDGIEPELISCARICEIAGCQSIVVHLREDQRHIQERDVYLLKKVIRTHFNLEMSCHKKIVEIACALKPDQATLVPERRKELTTEGGLDVVNNFKKVSQVVKKLNDARIAVSLFIDPVKPQIEAASKLVKIVELHTGRYADAPPDKKPKYLKEIITAARYAKDKGLTVAAGHGLDYENVSLIARIPEIEELNIGYSIICHAVFVGLEQAVKEMLRLVR